MILRSFFLALALVFTTLFQASFLSALPSPLGALPLTFIVGVLLYHFIRPNIGAAWLTGAGILLDLFSAPGPRHALSFTIAAVLGLFLARKFFANRSLYATLGLGACMYACALLVEGLWMASARAAADRALPLVELSAYFWSHLGVFVLALFLAFGLSRRGATALRRFFFFRS